MLKFNKSALCETEYILSDMPKNGSLFTTGNGYMGVRGSLEEFGETKVQGAFVRGIFDRITEIVDPFPDNIYMKKYYFDEEKLKKFQYQDSCINFPDFLLIRIFVNGKAFYPWEGKIIKWNRSLNACNGVLTREVVWDDGEGNVLNLKFERFASYDDEHKYIQRVTGAVKGEAEIGIFAGIDANVRTNGQIISEKISDKVDENGVAYSFLVGNKYRYTADICSTAEIYSDGKLCKTEAFANDGIYALKATLGKCKSFSVEKVSYVYTSRDEKKMPAEKERANYSQEYALHLKKYKKLFGAIDVKIDGDDKNDRALRFANYHTLISAEPNDSVHSLSAKALSGEKYNQFVWWDCEIYQMPVFTHTLPEIARHALEYRYRMLPAAKELAKKQGMKNGARYPFVSSVDGDEHVWIYARHPFLQIHIMSDIMYAVCDYYDNTCDDAFMDKKGLEMLLEISRWWMQRVEKTDRGYEIKNVTGTDEHHDYVDNDAYTNYLTSYVLKRTADFVADAKTKGSKVTERIGFGSDEFLRLKDIAENLYLPICESGMIPQFDGYFGLSRELEVDGSGTGKNFQMKQAGLYHKSQVIKQPDVALLYSYVNVGDLPYFNGNWDYYESMCEASSSLTFPVHAVCSAKAGRPGSFLKYFGETLFMDIKDIHNCAYQGIHSGCAAGGWYSVYAGVMGLYVKNGVVYANPNKMPLWKSVTLKFKVKNTIIKATLKGDVFTLKKLSGESVKVVLNGDEQMLKREAFCVAKA